MFRVQGCSDRRPAAILLCTQQVVDTWRSECSPADVVMKTILNSSGDMVHSHAISGWIWHSEVINNTLLTGSLVVADPAALVHVTTIAVPLV